MIIRNIWTILFFVATIYSVYYSRKLKEITKDKESGLISSEILHVVVPEIFSPVIAGAIYYYSWRKELPIRAKQANKYSWVIVGIVVFFGIIWNYLTGNSY